MTDENKKDDEPQVYSPDDSGEASEDAAPEAELLAEAEVEEEESDSDSSTADPGQGPDAELSPEDEAILERTAGDIVAEMRSDMLRAQAELVNFRTRVERDRAANREAVIAEVVRSLLPALDDLSRAEKHGDLAGSPLEIVGQKIRASFDRYGLKTIGEKGEVFDPNFHEAIVQLPSPDTTVNTVADVIEAGYALGDRVLRAAKVAVSVPAE
jgi:molecular chaperone GrpE